MVRLMRLGLPLLAVVAALVLASLAAAWDRPQEKVPGPAQAVLAFAKALKDHDLKGMAAWVVGGKTDLDYSKFVGDDWDVDPIYTEFKVNVVKVQTSGEHADVWCDISYRDLAGWKAEDPNDHVSLILEQGAWKIVPINRKEAKAGFLAARAYTLAHPEEALTRQDTYLAPTRNRTAQTKELGKKREAFFEQILHMPERRPERYPPENGYKSMTMSEHTIVLWPVGRSDEVIFYFYNEDEGLAWFTRWRLVGSKPQRMWQVELARTRHKVRRAKGGTLARWLTSYRRRLPARLPQDMKATLRKVQPYAAYLEMSAGGFQHCWVISKDGSEKRGPETQADKSISQDSYQATVLGFFITPAEAALLKH